MSESVIKRLPMHIANQIAAGEVVQRPESVVKELVENAIDAGADHVTIRISRAGKSLIQVEDNGAGMTEEDATLCLERHATSKIADYGDLERIATFGFRGEALPSIASVAQVELKTRRAEDELATVLRIAGGRIEEKTKQAGAVGTTITVRNLFFNTPARRQFLKADPTEFRHIADSVQRFLLSYPNVRFSFFNEGSPLYDIPPCPLAERIERLYGEKIAASLIEVSEETDVLTVSGFIGKPDFARKTRGDQYLFVNGRYIVSRLLNHAVVSSYEQMIGQGEYPTYILFLNLNPREIDVNVHPSKLEVKFGNERHVYTFVNSVVRQTLYRHDLVPSMSFREAATAEAGFDTLSPGGFDKPAAGAFDRTRLNSPNEDPARPFAYNQSTGGLGGYDPVDSRSSTGQRMDGEALDRLFSRFSDRPVASPDDVQGAEDEQETVILPSGAPASESGSLWQLHNKYILSPIKSGLMIIDQHVAHERILYERALQALDDASPFSQQLLFPHSFRVTPGDYTLIEELLPMLRATGFVVSLSAPNFVTVEAVPQDVRVGMEERILEEIVEQYKEYTVTETRDSRHNLAASYGCRLAIKSGDPLSPDEMRALIDQLFATSNPFVCPHGRPILIRLPLNELDRRFGRTS